MADFFKGRGEQFFMAGYYNKAGGCPKTTSGLFLSETPTKVSPLMELNPSL